MIGKDIDYAVIYGYDGLTVPNYSCLSDSVQQ